MPAFGRAGFTAIEVLIVIALTGIMAGFALPLLSGSLGRADAATHAAEALDALREAQSSAMSGKGNARYGVHFEAAKFVLFQGASYVPNDAANVTHPLSGFVSVTAVSLSPGGACTVTTGAGNCDVHFASVRGIPTESGTVTFTESGGVSRTLTIGAAGMMEWN